MHAVTSAFLTAILAALPMTALAQQATGRPPTDTAAGAVHLREKLVIRGLPRSGHPVALKSGQPEPAGYRPPCAAIAPGARRASVDIQIDNYALGSAELPPAGRWHIQDLGEAISGQWTCAYRFMIEGFTDTTGDTMVNEILSRRRAAEIKDRLVRDFGVNPDRLIIDGHGKDERYLKVWTPDNTDEPRNRRITITNLDAAASD